MIRRKILIDAVFINNGGGCVLLFCLVDLFLKSNFEVGIIADKRIAIPDRYASKVIDVVCPNLFSREKSIFKHCSGFDILLCFNNLPPVLRYSLPNFVYFHNVSYLKRAKNLKFFVKKVIFNWLLFFYGGGWIVQTDSVKSKLSELAASLCRSIEINVFPFFPEQYKVKQSVLYAKASGIPIRFVYVSDGHSYKNHVALFDAFSSLVKKGYVAELSVTVSENYPKLLNYISDLRSAGFPIINYSNIKHSEMADFLLAHHVAVYPSSYESFGLGLIEAAQANLPIIASNRQFVLEVVKPFRVFDETSKKAIHDAMEDCLNFDLTPSRLVVSDLSLEFCNFLMEHSYVISK